MNGTFILKLCMEHVEEQALFGKFIYDDVIAFDSSVRPDLEKYVWGRGVR